MSRRLNWDNAGKAALIARKGSEVCSFPASRSLADQDKIQIEINDRQAQGLAARREKLEEKGRRKASKKTSTPQEYLVEYQKLKLRFLLMKNGRSNEKPVNLKKKMKRVEKALNIPPDDRVSSEVHAFWKAQSLKKAEG